MVHWWAKQSYSLFTLDFKNCPVTRWRSRYILVHGWDLLIPADAQTAALGDDEVELHAQDSSGAGGVHGS